MRLRCLALIAAVFALAGCAGYELDRARTVTPPDDPYAATLYAAYIELSSSEFQRGDYVNSDFFARRAIAAARGIGIDPDSPIGRELTGSEPDQARRRLNAVLNRQAAVRAPRDLAAALSAFDCWLEESEEGREAARIAGCRKRFEDALGALEQALADSG